MSTIELHPEPIVLRIARAFARYIGFGEEEPELAASPALHLAAHVSAPKPRIRRPLEEEPSLRLMPSSAGEAQHPGHKWQRHSQLRAYEAPLSEEVRIGRHEAVRGLFAARAGALDVATRHFAIAARCHEVDITAVPGFWNLTRGQMRAAVEAYTAVGRYRDAAALDAQIASVFRPSLVGSSREPIVPARPHHKAAST